MKVKYLLYLLFMPGLASLFYSAWNNYASFSGFYRDYSSTLQSVTSTLLKLHNDLPSKGEARDLLKHLDEAKAGMEDLPEFDFSSMPHEYAPVGVVLIELRRNAKSYIDKLHDSCKFLSGAIPDTDPETAVNIGHALDESLERVTFSLDSVLTAAERSGIPKADITIETSRLRKLHKAISKCQNQVQESRQVDYEVSYVNTFLEIEENAISTANTAISHVESDSCRKADESSLRNYSLKLSTASFDPESVGFSELREIAYAIEQSRWVLIEYLDSLIPTVQASRESEQMYKDWHDWDEMYGYCSALETFKGFKINFSEVCSPVKASRGRLPGVRDHLRAQIYAKTSDVTTLVLED